MLSCCLFTWDVECLPPGLVRRWPLSCWMKTCDEEAEKTMFHSVLVPFQCNPTACYSRSHPTKIRRDLKMPWGQSIYFFNSWKRPFLQTNLKKIVLSMNTMKRASSKPTRFSCSHPIIMPLSVSMSSTGTAAFPGKDSFLALTKVPVHSWPGEAFCWDEITHRMSPGHSFLHLQVLI